MGSRFYFHSQSHVEFACFLYGAFLLAVHIKLLATLHCLYGVNVDEIDGWLGGWMNGWMEASKKKSHNQL